MRFAGHTHFVTIGLAIGRPDCPVPDLRARLDHDAAARRADAWPVRRAIVHDAFTTVGNWRGYGSVEHDGVLYGQKAHSLRRFIDRAGSGPTSDSCSALAIHPDEAEGPGGAGRQRLASARPGARSPAHPADYQRFIRGSRAEFGIAKSGYVASRCGWFSDRSVCYLASGRPVLAQETGFSHFLPAGEGLFAFDSTDECSPPSRSSGRTTPATRGPPGPSPRSSSTRIRSSVGSWTSSSPLGSRDRRAGGRAAEPPCRRGREMHVGGPLSDSMADADRAAFHLAVWPALDDLLRRHDPDLGRIVRLDSRPCDDRTSFHLVDLEIDLEDGSALRLLLKDLGRSNLHETARRVKPDFLYNPLREIGTYRELLSRDRLARRITMGRSSSRMKIATGSSWKRSRALGSAR